MAFQIGKFDIAIQNGSAGTTENGVRYAREHTGRAPHQKQARGVAGSAEAILNLAISGKAPFMSLTSNAVDVAWNTTSAQVTVLTNAEKFQVSSSGKAVTLQSSASYTVNALTGTFSSNLGLDAQHSVVLNFGITNNNTASGVTAPVVIKYWDGAAYQTAGTFTINQSSADADVSITVTPSTVPVFEATGSKKTVSVVSNVAYSIEKQGADTAWFTISRTTGVVGTAGLDIVVVAQAVAAPVRSGAVIFKNPISGSAITVLEISQAKGETFEITIAPSSLTFLSSELNTIKNVQVTANANWTIEEIMQ